MKRATIFLTLLLPMCLLLGLGFVINGRIQAKPQAVEVGGLLTEDTVWTAVNSPYILTDTVFIPVGITLTVEPGVTVLGKSLGGIIVEGNIVAIGTPAQPITFTSVTDSAPGEWPGFFFWDGAGHFENVSIRYGGENVSDPSSGKPPSGANVNITNKTDSSGGGDLIIRDSIIHGSNGFGIAVPAMNLFQFELENVTFTENITNRVHLITYSSTPMTGTVTLLPQPGLEGYEISKVGLIVTLGTLTLDPGTTLFIPHQSGIVLQGGNLVGNGTPENPVTITSVSDSDADRWGGILMWDGIAHFYHTEIRYGGEDIGQFAVSVLHIFDVPAGEEVILENSTIYGSSSSAIAVEIDSLHQLQMENNSFIENDKNRIQLITSFDSGLIELEGDAQLPQQDGLEAYELLAPGLVVPAGVTLTAEAGTTFMITPTEQITVAGGHLQAVGTAVQPIIFTSLADSGAGEWAGIVLQDGTAQLDYTEVRYGVDNLVVNNTAVSQTVSLQNSWLHSGSSNGLRLEDGAVTAVCTTFSNNGSAGVFVSSGGSPDLLISDSTMNGNGGDGLLNSHSAEIDARNNWWGDATGPSGLGSGSGDAVQGNVLFAPWLMEEPCSIQAVQLFLPTIMAP